MINYLVNQNQQPGKKKRDENKHFYHFSLKKSTGGRDNQLFSQGLLAGKANTQLDDGFSGDCLVMWIKQKKQKK